LLPEHQRLVLLLRANDFGFSRRKSPKDRQMVPLIIVIVAVLVLA
jgi:hypothetical protein